jgi:hypothetical protein
MIVVGTLITIGLIVTLVIVGYGGFKIGKYFSNKHRNYK